MENNIFNTKIDIKSNSFHNVHIRRLISGDTRSKKKSNGSIPDSIIPPVVE